MHTIFPIFLTQSQFGILWMGNVTSSSYGPFMNHLRSSNIPCICYFSFLPCCWVHTWK